MPRPSVLIVADDAPLRALQPALERAGFQVTATQDGHEAAPLAERTAPDVVLLGHKIPGIDALEVCRRIQGQLPPSRHPIFLLAPDRDETHRGNGRATDRTARRLVQGIRSLLGRPESGSADLPLDSLPLDSLPPDSLSASSFSPSPMSKAEFADVTAGHRLHVPSLTIDRHRHQVLLDGRVLPLTLTEFRIIWALALQPGYVVSRRQLTDACRGDGSQVQERTIDVHIKSVRRKLGGWSGLIETVRGVGYRLQDSLVAINPTASQSTVE